MLSSKLQPFRSSLNMLIDGTSAVIALGAKGHYEISASLDMSRDPDILPRAQDKKFHAAFNGLALH